MAARNSDVNLVIRARNDADRAINSVADSLEALFGDAKDANGGLSDLGRTLASLDKAFTDINSKADAAGSAFQRQQSAISETRQQLASVEAQAESAARALEKLRAEAVDEVLAGRDQSPVLRQIEQVEQAQAELAARAATLTRTIDVQASSLHKSETGLLGLSSTLFAVRDGQAEAAARIELTNQGLREQAAAAERVSEVQQRINNLTGVNRPDATGSAARAADLLLAADAEFRLAEARRENNSRLAERAALEATLERTTGAGRVRATDSGATFSALAEREKQAEEGERAAKAERDLAAATNATNSALAERAQIEAALERNTGVGRSRAIDNGATVTALTELVNKEHQAALGLAQMDIEAEQLRAALDPLAAIQDRYNVALTRFREIAKSGKLSADELASAEQLLAAETDRARAALQRGEHVGKVGLFGLKPYELQNLSYQINDIATQLASGTSLTQTLGQQGGQILQLFPRLTSAIFGAFKNPAVIGAAVVFGTVALAIKKAADEAERLRDYAGQTTFRTDASAYNPESLLAAEKGLQRIGASAEDARAAVEIVAARLRELAVAKEQRDVEKQNEAARKAARQEREREIRQFQSRVVGAEGGTGKNPYSTAKGYGQFTESTFISQFNKVFPDRASTMSRDQILALRQNEQVARAIIDNYSRENARFLESFGAKVTAGNLYLAHFLGAGGAKAVLTAPGNRPVDQIIQRLPNAGAVLSGNQGYLRTDGGKGRYRTASELQAFIGNRVGDTGAAQSQGQAAISDLIEDNQRRQEQFNLAIRHGNEERQRGVDALRAEAGLYDGALLAERRRQAVADAELELRQKVEDANKNLKPGETAVIVTPEQVAQAKELAGALFDAQHAREALDGRLNAAQRPLSNLEEQRDLLIQQRDLLESMGEFEAADDVRDQIQALGGSIDEAYEKLIAFYQALSPTERVQLGIVDQAQLDNLIRKLDIAREKSKEWGRILGISARDWASAISGNATRAVTSFIERVASGRNVFGALGQSVREFAAGFISSIAQMIIQLAAFAAAVAILRALGVPIPASTFGSVGGGSVKAGVNHAGGIAGSAGGVQRTVSAAAFARAMRYHTGGIAGFKPNEVPAILEQGEEVLTKGDPRHRANAGAGGDREQPINLKNVNVWDMGAAADEILATKQGQRAVLNIVNRNKRALQGKR